MSDRELLELAAKAYGFGAEYGVTWTESEYPKKSGKHGALWNGNGYMDTAELWNPLTDDGDALRLAVSLGIKVTPYPIYQWPKHSVMADRLELSTDGTSGPQVIEPYGDDARAATRRAVLLVAAEIARQSTPTENT
jgi:hypothetical protein